MLSEVKVLHRPLSLCSIESARAPIARPESGIDDSDNEDKPQAQRISRRWETFRLSMVEQSSDSLEVTPRQRSSTNEKLIERTQVLSSKCTKSSASTSLPGSLNASRTLSFYSPRGKPPRKPPRTFATEFAQGVPSFSCKPPPKPPRTFEHCSEQDLNSKTFSSLDWDFPISRTTDSNTYSLTEVQNISVGEIFPAHNPHKRRKRFANSDQNPSAEPMKDNLSFNSVINENKPNSFILKSNSLSSGPHSHNSENNFFTRNLTRKPLSAAITPNTFVKILNTESNSVCPKVGGSSPDFGTSEGHDFDSLCWSCGDTAGIALVTAGSCKPHENEAGFLETVI